MMSNILEYRNVDIHYGKKQVIENVSLSMKPGEILGIVGESGSGKSTLIRAAMGLLGEGGMVTQGQILYQGTNATIDMTQIHGEEMRRLRGAEIGMIFQNAGASLCPIRTIEEQLYEAVLEHESISKGEIRDRALELFEQLRFTNGEQILKSYPFEFSGGMNQRVGIVLAMVLRPRLLLADEPTSALDVTVQLQVLREMKKLRDMYGTSIVLVTHNIGVVNYLADHVAVMHQGKLVEYGTKEDVLNHPQDAYTKKLIGSVLHLKRS
ncbi:MULTISPECIES: ABC transporter ATP-binding protein [Clostridia]|jgi:peptide/nickel transport system ATP-binding protein|uniref:ABC transporter ATP-binding protein n=1 Tax=Clostridia TaxID=186801 RepID=UPI000E46EEF3|nr:ABC transporter ATP-binding protein [Roseburia sp. OM02-15]